MNEAKSVKVSVIMPVYNVAGFLPECLDSLLRQSMREFEVICVDDGSTDESPRILDDYARKDSRIQVIHQKNAGAGAARNVGLKLAVGEYVHFFDPDDSCERGMLKGMYRRAKQTAADVVIAGRIEVDGQTGKVLHRKGFSCGLWALGTTFSARNLSRTILTIAKSVPWDKLFRREFILSHGLRFQEIRRSNDIYFVDMALILAERISLVPHAYYRYRKNREGSLQATKDTTPLVFLEAYKALRSHLERLGLFDDFGVAYTRSYVGSVCYNLRKFADAENFKECYHAVRAEFLELNEKYDLRLGLMLASTVRVPARMIVLNEDPQELQQYYADRRNVQQKMDIPTGVVWRMKQLLPVGLKERIKIVCATLIRLVRAVKPARSGSSTKNEVRSVDAVCPHPDVSVILPVYNVGAYLKECLATLETQTLRNIEFICVDDGSTDSSLPYLHVHAKNDGRYRIIRQNHEGAGAARNAGLAVARGRYLAFLDADDFCAQDLFERVVRKADETQAEVVVFSRIACDAETGTCRERQCVPRALADRPQPFPAAEAAFELYNKVGHAAWNKLFRADYIRGLDLKFQCLARSNDLYFVSIALSSASRVAVERDAFYWHRSQRADGLQMTRWKSPLCVFDAYSAVWKTLSERGMSASFGGGFLHAAYVSGCRALAPLVDSDVYEQAYARFRGLLLGCQTEPELEKKARFKPQSLEMYRLIVQTADASRLRERFAARKQSSGA